LKIGLVGGFFGLPRVNAEEPLLSGGYDMGVYRVTGGVSLDGEPISSGCLLSENSIIDTAADGEVILVIKHDVFLIRPNSHIEFSGGHGTVRSIDVWSGGLYGVADKQKGRHKLKINLPNAALELYKAGFYIEADNYRDYVCTCHGMIRIFAKNSLDKDVVISQVHDEPRYVYSERPSQSLIQKAPIVNHSDSELGLLLSIQGKHLNHPSFLEIQGRVRRKLF